MAMCNVIIIITEFIKVKQKSGQRYTVCSLIQNKNKTHTQLSNCITHSLAVRIYGFSNSPPRCSPPLPCL